MNEDEGTKTDEQSVEAESTSAELVVEEPTAVVPTQEAAPSIPVSTDIVVIAKDPEEMAIAQKNLVDWAKNKIAVLKSEADEAKTNLELAIKRKWGATAFKRAVTTANGRVVYYEKILAALEAGYVIIPDMPAQTISIRTSRKAPMADTKVSSWNHTNLPSAESDGSAAGKGRYVSPAIEFKTWSDTKKLTDGRESTTHYARATGYSEGFDFPLALVKPQILDDTNRAMVHKIFDEIGILGAGSARPGKKLPATSTTRPDPIVLGRIVRQEGTKRFSCAFLITWWLDTRTI